MSCDIDIIKYKDISKDGSVNKDDTVDCFNDDNNDDNEEDYDSYSSSETDEINDDIPDVNDVELTKKETFCYRVIDKYYKNLDLKKIESMIQIIDGKSNISLRLLDWFITKYSNRHKIRFERKDKDDQNIEQVPAQLDDNENDDIRFDKYIDKGFNVHISYKAQLKSYKKRYFDPFRRRKKFRYYFGKDKKISLVTTIGQLNFFKWAFNNDVIEYVSNNFTSISKIMGDTTKSSKNKTKKKKPVRQSRNNKNIKEPKLGKTEITDEEINVKKNGININAKKKIKENEVKIVLSFD